MSPSIDFPLPPWRAVGHALQETKLVPVATARRTVPKEFEVVSVAGHTLGGVVALHYGKGSTVEYNELTVISGVVKYHGQAGLWISNIYVDNPVALRAGRQVWGVDKKMARFDWSPDYRQVAVHQDQDGEKPTLLVRLKTRLSIPVPQFVINLLKPHLKIPYVSKLGSTPLTFAADATQGEARLGFGLAELSYDAASPLTKLGFGSLGGGVQLPYFDLTATAPVPIPLG